MCTAIWGMIPASGLCIQLCFFRSTGKRDMQIQLRSQFETIQRTSTGDVLPLQVLGPETAVVWEVQNQPESRPPLAVPQVLPGHVVARSPRH